MIPNLQTSPRQYNQCCLVSGPRQHGFNNPTGVTCLAPGKVLVAEQGRYQVSQVNNSGQGGQQPRQLGSVA